MLHPALHHLTHPVVVAAKFVAHCVWWYVTWKPPYAP
jgi:hypothetical protein